MASAFSKLQELDLSRDEVERLSAALKKQEFRQLLAEYVQEVQDPENRKLYEQEIRELERERGVEVTFIHPKGVYVLKTSCDGDLKCFINICVNENVAQPSSVAETRDGVKGLQWSLPHSLTAGRNDVDNKGVKCVVYDVVFHPDTLVLASKNKDFRDLINTTACEAIEAQFSVTLDHKNLKFPKLKYKGVPKGSMVRKQMENFVAKEMEPNEKQFFEKIYNEIDSRSSNFKPKPKKTNVENKTTYTTPKYVIKHRQHVDIQECLEEKTSKQFSAIPKELIIDIQLPLLKSSTDVTLDVTEKTIQLFSEKPSKYKLNLTLPYRVNQANGNAKFDKDLKKLIITLPVKRIEYDSGIESDPTSPITEELPEFTCHRYNNVIAFTLNVKHVLQESISKIIERRSLYVTFTTKAHYGFYVKFDANIIKEGVVIESWDNNVIVQIPIDSDIEFYYYGLNPSDLSQNFFEEPKILNSVLEEEEEEEETLEESPVIPIAHSYESSGDELSLSYSPSTSRGILKRLANRHLNGRSVSESSIDELFCSSLDSAIPEDVESTSLKKTVRFNDVIMRQLYRSNASILGQKKKNQRKSRNKKRAQERRHSESEASDKEDKMGDGISDIFDMDMPI